RLFDLSILAQRITELPESVAQIGLELQRALIKPNRFIKAILISAQLREIKNRLGKIRAQLDCPRERRSRLVFAIRCDQYATEAVPCGRALRIENRYPPICFDRLGGSITLSQRIAQCEMKLWI